MVINLVTSSLRNNDIRQSFLIWLFLDFFMLAHKKKLK